MAKTVILESQTTALVDERLCGEAILPGTIVRENSLSAFVKTALDGKAGQLLVLLENDLAGTGVATALALGAVGRAAVLKSGDRANLRAAATLTCKVGDFLTVDTAGRVKASSSTDVPYVKAMEAITVSATADALVYVEAV